MLYRFPLSDNPKAFADFSKVIELDPKLAEAYYQRALVRPLDDHAGKIADTTRSIDLDPTDVKVYFVRAVSRRLTKDYTGAVADLSKCIEEGKAQSLAGYYFYRGKNYFDMNKNVEAIADFTKAIELKPTYGEAYAARADVYDKQGEKAKADADRTKAADLKKS